MHKFEAAETRLSGLTLGTVDRGLVLFPLIANVARCFGDQRNEDYSLKSVGDFIL